MWCWIFTDSARLIEHDQPRLKYCSLIQMPGTTLPVQNPSFKARGLMLIGHLQLHSHSPAILLKMDPNFMSRGAAHSTLGGALTLLQQLTRVFKPKESATLPHGIHNALQHLLLYCELDYLTSFSVSPFSICLGLSAQLCSFIPVSWIGRTSNVNKSATKTLTALADMSKSTYWLKQSCTSLEHAKANETFTEEVSRCGSAILTALHQML